MKISMDTKSFTNAVSWATKDYDTKDTNAFVSLVVNKKDGTARIYHSKLRSFMMCYVDVEFTEKDMEDVKDDEVAIPMDGKFLIKLSGALSGEKTVISKDLKKLDSELVIRTVGKSSGRFVVPVLAKKNVPQFDLVSLGEVDDREFFAAMTRLSRIVSGSDSSGVFENIHMSLNDKTVVLMGTDRYVIAEIVVGFEKNDTKEVNTYIQENPVVLIPKEASKLVAPSSGVISSATLVFDKKSGKFGYKFIDGRIALFSLTEGVEPIGYTSAKKRSVDNIEGSVVVDLSEMSKAIRNVSALNFNDDPIVFQIHAGPREENSENGRFFVQDDKGKNKIEIESQEYDLQGEDIVLRYLPKVIMPAQHPLNTSKVEVSWIKNRKGSILRPVLDDGTLSDTVLVIAQTLKNN